MTPDETTGLLMKYLVLKPRGEWDDHYSHASRVAMRSYAKSIKPYDPELAIKLDEWANTEHAEAYDRYIENLPK